MRDRHGRGGFSTLELTATMAGVPLYTAFGFVPVHHVEDTFTGTRIPLVRMTMAWTSEADARRVWE